MTTRRRPEDVTDERFWAIVATLEDDPREAPPTGGPGLGPVALVAGAVALSIAVALFRLHLIAGVVWLYVGAPALVLAAVCPADRALQRCRRQARTARSRRSGPAAGPATGGGGSPR